MFPRSRTYEGPAKQQHVKRTRFSGFSLSRRALDTPTADNRPGLRAFMYASMVWHVPEIRVQASLRTTVPN